MRLTRRQALAVAAVSGIFAAVLLYIYLTRNHGPRKPAEKPKVAVVVAARDISIGERIRADMLETKTVPREEVPSQAVKSPDQIAGWIAVRDIRAGDIVTAAAVRKPGPTLGLAFLVPEGMRAVTVAIDQVSGLSGLVQPGDHVDVLATFELDDGTSVTRTVLQDVEVLALGSQLVPVGEGEEAGERRAPTKPQPTATLAVTPHDAQKLVLAEAEGKIRLVLRRAGDKAHVALEPSVSWSLIGYKPKQEAEKAPTVQAQAVPPYYGPYPPQAKPAAAQAGPGQAAAAGKGAEKEGPPGIEVIRGGEREVVIP